MNEAEDAIVRLETRIAYQDDAIDQLSDRLYAQSLAIDRLEHRCAALQSRLEALAEDEDTPATDETPPHY